MEIGLNMFFLGDIAIPHGVRPTIEKLNLFNNVIANLEGCIATEEMVSLQDDKLFSNDNIIDFLKQLNVVGVTLANNHITDVPQAFDRTKELLTMNSIKHGGAGTSLAEASEPIVIEEDGIQYVLLAFGWDVVSCKYVRNGKLGVNPLTELNVLTSIKASKENYPDSRIIILPHWDYELERYPMPMQRELAKKAIEAGAFAVIGHHPHCIQDIEIYKNHLICYSLGNWFIPEKIYMDGNLKLPAYTYSEYAIDVKAQGFTVHKFCYVPDGHTLTYNSCKCFSYDSNYSECEFDGMSDAEYLVWFRKKRVKKKLLPVFSGTDESMINKMKSNFVKCRHKLLKFINHKR